MFCSSTPAPSEISGELDRIVNSPQFRRAAKLQMFLRVTCDYAVQDRSSEITEFLIATEAFGKSSRFDPTQDSIVRVQAREVRRRLKDYYQNEGKDSPLQIDYPIGTYSPVFLPKHAPALPVPEEVTAPVTSAVDLPLPHPLLAGPGWPRWLLIAACTVIFVFALTTAQRLRSSQAKEVAAGAGGPKPRGEVAALWDRFLTSDVPTMLIMSNPAIEICPEETGVRRVASVGPGCEDQYTGMGEAVALHLITNLFRTAGKPLIVRQSTKVSAEDLEHHHVVTLGGRVVNNWTAKLFGNANLASYERELTSATFSDEARQRFRTVVDGNGKLVRDRALIALLRNPSTGLWVMAIYGRYSQGTHAAAEAVTDEDFLRSVSWGANRRPYPDAFRLLMSVDVDNGMPGRVVPVAVLVR